MSHNETKFVEGLWQFERIGVTPYKVLYKVTYIGASDKAILIAATGVEQNLQLLVPFAHSWLSICIYHIDSNAAETADALTFKLRRLKDQNQPKLFAHTLANKSITVSQSEIEFDPAKTLEASMFTMSLTSTLNYKVTPVIYIEKLGAFMSH